ncbi:Hypothetical_protein [Hexamita inflata]|uniref:Hypothetical_protein n=1 Tax=Hexamita inflata TaxID=28002 RepID=A0ABP1HR22_9EUKA
MVFCSVCRSVCYELRQLSATYVVFSKEATELWPLSNPEGSLMAYPQPYGSLTAAQHFESENFTVRNRFSQSASQKLNAARNDKRNRMNTSFITQNKASIPAIPLQLDVVSNYSYNFTRCQKKNNKIQHNKFTHSSYLSLKCSLYKISLQIQFMYQPQWLTINLYPKFC